ncbi:MAG: cysteine desulfurase [Campylobacteraceae bacterium]|nr:cysteine desulfurase [Campylobacteraceae bacterium]
MSNHIYLDFQSTTPLDEITLKSMIPYFSEKFANASSSHALGIENSLIIEKSRRLIARDIGSNQKEIIFTSGATESNNIAINCITKYHGKGEIITVKTEHKSILDSCKELEDNGFTIKYLNVDKFGLICLSQLKKEITKDTILVSIMYGNNETGVLQPINQISKITKALNIPLHCDATQSIGLLSFNVKELGIDMLTFSSHKFYGPKGVGGLFIDKSLKIAPLIKGLQHEKGMRSGTYNLPGIVGMQVALNISRNKQKDEYMRLIKLRDRFLEKIKSIKYICNTPLKSSLPHCLSLSFPNVNMQKFLSRLNKVILSTGSACNSGNQQESHVLTAMGINKTLVNSTIRLSFGRATSESDVDNAAIEIINAANYSYVV